MNRLACGRFLRTGAAGPPFGVVEGGPDGGPAGEALIPDCHEKAVRFTKAGVYCAHCRYGLPTLTL